MQIRAAVVTVSDKGYAGKREDRSGPLVADLLRGIGAEVVVQTIVPDEPDEIRRALIHLADDLELDLVLTTGGTGFTPRDRTPEATRAVVGREAPGLAEVLRMEGYRRTPLAVLSRGTAGLRGRTLIINLPGSPKAVREGMEVLIPILPHAVRMARGVDTEHHHEEEHA
ncbi:MAG TPA: MogA/MoaB family molybdenum cofactor biosynthesis protein [Anaerolineales bacterium]|nr:MogA/MoaB family molybdenum cofactor biosynthesis protein [Anaerolineae bacterium]HIQ02359.1 MogA/MoaB family molybdenum cofactor biosynthesis protein [Anaerolineales bacterium]